MEIWLKQGKEELQFPVLVSNFEITSPQNNQTVITNALGEINIKGTRGLRTLSLSSFFPRPKNNYGNDIVEYTGFEKPYTYVKKIERWKRKKGVPCKCILTGVLNMWCLIENFVYGEQDGTGDVYFTIELKEYIKLKPVKNKTKKKKLNKKQTKIKQPETKRQTKEIKTTTYRVKKGDTLAKIAKKCTGDSNNLLAIANQNNIENPNRIDMGQELVIKIDKSGEEGWQ